MPFKQSFEQNVNNAMQDHGQPGRAPTEAEDRDMAMKKAPLSPQPAPEDWERYEKKGQPPRFSTLFGATLPAPPPPQEYQREYYARPERKSGVFMPMPLFIVFAIILFFESTILFAYTVIGLYNNAPSRLFAWAGPGNVAACDCSEKQPAVGIAPVFALPQGPGVQAITEMVTVTATPSSPSTTSSLSSSTSTSTSPTSSSTSSIDHSSQAALAASEVLGALGALTLSSATTATSLTSITPSQVRPTVTSVKLITEDPSGNTISARPTVTQTTFVDGPAATAEATSSATSNDNAAAWASVSSALAEAEAAITPDPIPSTTEVPTTLETVTTPAPTTESPVETTVSSESSSTASATGKVCFGGSGGVMLNCV